MRRSTMADAAFKMEKISTKAARGAQYSVHGAAHLSCTNLMDSCLGSLFQMGSKTR